MKFRILLSACYLLLWTLAEGQVTEPKIKVDQMHDGIKLSCGAGNTMHSSKGRSAEFLEVQYKNENSGEYTCETGNKPKIFVRFRTCENCVELDVASIVGMVVGNLVATIVIGVAVYLIASQSRISPVTMDKKRSDRQHLIPNEMNSRAPNDHYQPLKHKSGQKDMYDVLNRR